MRIFEAFENAEGRHAHDRGLGGRNFGKRSEELKKMLAYPAQLYRLDVLHGKFDVISGKPVGAKEKPKLWLRDRYVWKRVYIRWRAKTGKG